MRFRHRHESSIPDINLIPMLNVLLGVLAFFVIITMTLGQSQGINVQLPAEATDEPLSTPLDNPIPPMKVKLATGEQYLVDDTPVEREILDAIVARYLASGDDALVFLLADPDVPYDNVISFLVAMKQVGGDRVSLALEDAPIEP